MPYPPPARRARAIPGGHLFLPIALIPYPCIPVTRNPCNLLTPPPAGEDLLGCIDCFGRAALLRLPQPGRGDEASGEVAPSFLTLLPPPSVASREGGWAGITMAQRGECGGGSGTNIATALRFGKAAAVYSLGEGSGSSTLPLRVFHTLGYPTSMSWAGPDATLLAIAEDSRVTLWDVRQVWIKFGQCTEYRPGLHR